MPDSLLGGQGATLLTAIIIVAVALLALVGVFWLIRKRASSTFIRGGKNRQPRLAVLDATAVDTRRRLVLIRRDDVEHLVMIGGPTDIVIESGITQPSGQRPAQPMPPQQQRAEPPAAAPRPVTPEKPRAAAPPPERSVEPAVERPHRPVTNGSQPPARPQPPVSAPATAATVAAAAGAAGSIRTEAADVLDSARTRVFQEPSFDERAFDELTAALEPEEPARPAPQPSRPSPAAPSGPRAAAGAEFEAVLAAELSQDLTQGAPEDSFFTAQYNEHLLDPDEAEMIEPPEVKPETQPSRDSLEAEMERLLGDISRKP